MFLFHIEGHRLPSNFDIKVLSTLNFEQFIVSKAKETAREFIS